MNDYPLNNNVRKKVAVKNKKKKKEVVELPDTESSDEELDLTKDCHPIAHYVNNRAEMISQMFSVIKGNKLKAMLPPLLKDFDVEKLKLICLDQLLGMSEKRITCILEGEILESSSESDVATGESEDSEPSVLSEKVSSHTSSKRKRNKRKHDRESLEKSSKTSKVVEGAPAPEGKTLLEILELEMRARAIRALLKQGPGVETAPTWEEASNGNVVDLTVDEEDFPTVVKIEPPSTEQEQSFEDKIVKSSEKSREEVAKKQKLIAELELRNKLIKKKTYRTRQQRMENVDEDRNEPVRDVAREVAAKVVIPEIVVKEEPAEIVIEDPEEGEVTSEEEEPQPIAVKEESSDFPEPEAPIEKPMDGVRISAIDDGEFVSNSNVEFEAEAVEVVQVVPEPPGVIDLEVGSEDEGPEEAMAVDDKPNPEADEGSQGTDASAVEEEGSSWRSRWLRNDDVQKVFKSSKICGIAKKRFAEKQQQAAAMLVEEPVVPDVVVPEPAVVVEGSVSEYQQLFGKKVEDVSSNSGQDIIVPSDAAVESGKDSNVAADQLENSSVSDDPVESSKIADEPVANLNIAGDPLESSNINYEQVEHFTFAEDGVTSYGLDELAEILPL